MLYPELGSVCAVIVTYNIGEALHANVAATLPQVDFCIIIDNGSTDNTLAVLERIKAEQPDKVEVLHNPENGLAKAQNMGIRRAQESGHGWVLLLDHDSRPEADMVVRLGEHYRTLAPTDKETIGLLCPLVFDDNLEAILHYLTTSRYGWVTRCHAPTRRGFGEALCVFASGSLIPLSVVQKVGFMDESLFIDYIDTDFCLRLRRHGLKVHIVYDSLLHHSIGALTQKTIGDVTLRTTNHSATRRYYIYRNKLIIGRRHLMNAPGFVLFDVVRSAYDIARIVCFEDEKKEKLCAIALGIWHGLCGVTGKKLS